ncbi:MAG: hypothetical protein H0V07_09290 [Propionibacteriales bacterium]|nr:hypothetical protein [Propionibacteriales bacterium]
MTLIPTDLHSTVLATHVASGTAALLLASVVLASGWRQDWTSPLGRAYVAAVCLVAFTALLLVTSTGSTLPPGVRALLGVVAVVTAAAAVRGLRIARRRPGDADWRPTHLRLMWGSVTSLVSAVAVVSAPPALWIAVIIAGTALTEYSYRRARRGPVVHWSPT